MSVRKLKLAVGTLAAATALVGSMIGAAVAGADEYIDYGTSQAACKAAAKQANALVDGYSYCFETGPGHYSLYLATD